MLRIHTERLELMTAPLDLVQAMAEGRRTGFTFPAVLPADWPQADLSEFLPAYAGILAADREGACWGVWLMIEKATRTVVGDIGFVGRPDEGGRVEIGYSVLPAWREQGYATEAGRALVAWALTQPGVEAVRANTQAENRRSGRVLEKVGMRCLGAEGAMVNWEIARGN